MKNYTKLKSIVVTATSFSTGGAKSFTLEKEGKLVIPKSYEEGDLLFIDVFFDIWNGDAYSSHFERYYPNSDLNEVYSYLSYMEKVRDIFFQEFPKDPNLTDLEQCQFALQEIIVRLYYDDFSKVGQQKIYISCSKDSVDSVEAYNSAYNTFIRMLQEQYSNQNFLRGAVRVSSEEKDLLYYLLNNHFESEDFKINLHASYGIHQQRKEFYVGEGSSLKKRFFTRVVSSVAGLKKFEEAYPFIQYLF